MDKNKDNLNKNGPWWKQGVEIFSEISTWIIVPIILALITGKALDKHFDTGYLILIIFVVISFGITSYGIVRAVKKYATKIKEENKKDK